MEFEIRADGLHIEGYVNAVERDSRVVIAPECGRCVEQIKSGAFAEALRAAENVDLLLNHDRGHKAGSTLQGNLRLTEDNIGLRASADITDVEIIEKARAGLLRGWSFGFTAKDTTIEQRAEGVPRRHINSLAISEVSIIDDRFTPCYAGTSIEVRADGDELIETRYDVCHDMISDRTDSLQGYRERLNKALLDGYRIRAKLLGILSSCEERGGNYIQQSNGKMNGSTPSGNSGNNSSGNALTNGGQSGIIKATPKQKQEIENVVKGAKDMNGIVIKSVSQHAADRIIQRGFTAEQVADSINNAKIVYPGNKPLSHCTQLGKDYRTVYSDSGVLISVIKLK